MRVPRQPKPDAELSLCQSPVSCGFRAHSRQRGFAKGSRNLCLIFNYENTQRAAFLNIAGLAFTSVALPNSRSVNGFMFQEKRSARIELPDYLQRELNLSGRSLRRRNQSGIADGCSC